ncbi:conserved hypothetical protein [Ricinus communis]|uniref:Prephenate dehydratase n=1 Tax=Ricinus communis TaxID=3988 RepID=B9TM79_RICCO|nr:conserved hypothetical protein [Ricinus communis]
MKKDLIRFVTLGPAGSNHEFVTGAYLRHHGISEFATVELVLTFEEAAQKVISGMADHIIQVAVHPSTAAIVGQNRHELFIIDAFVSPSKEMAVVTRTDVEHPKSLALQPATQTYVDTSGLELIPETSIGSVAEGLLAGKYESGLTYSSLATENPARFRIDFLIGTVDDAWIVYGRQRLSDGKLVSWQESPAARQFHQSAHALTTSGR